MKRPEIAAAIFFLSAFLFNVWAASVGWNHTIIDEHGFRQTQTAIAAYFIKSGGPFWAYETPVLGPPWSIPFELPLYQWLVAKLSWLTNYPLEQSGRLVARLFYCLTALPLFSLAVGFGFGRVAAWILAGLFLLSPLGMFWSRTFLIESTAVFLAASYLACAERAISTGKRHFLVLALLFGLLATTVKITTFAAFGLAAFFWWAISLRGKNLRGEIEIVAGLFVLPFVTLVAWTAFADATKAANPLAGFILSKNLQSWNYGTLEQRVSGDFWYMLFRKHLHGAIGHRTTWILSLLFVFFVSQKHRKFYFISLFLFLLPPLLFTNLHIIHDYYATANAPFLVIALALVIAGLLSESNPSWKQIAGVLFLVTAVGLSVRTFLGQPYHVQSTNFPAPIGLGKMIQERVPPNDVIFVYNFDWHPMIPYYSQRRAIMNRNKLAMNSPEMQASLNSLGDSDIGAVVLCDNPANNNRVLQEIRTYVDLEEKPFSTAFCVAYSRNKVKK
jgi:hypothetical protein